MSTSTDDPLASLGSQEPDGQTPVALLHGLPVEAFVVQSVEIEPEALSEQLRMVPGLVAYWNARHAAARAALQRATQQRHAWRARKRMELRASAAKVTEAVVADLLEGDEEYVRQELACIELEAEAARLEGYARAMEAKKGMLMSLGGLLRDELRGEPTLRKEWGR